MNRYLRKRQNEMISKLISLKSRRRRLHIRLIDVRLMELRSLENHVKLHRITRVGREIIMKNIKNEADHG